MTTPDARGDARQLWARVAIGIVLGAIYVASDAAVDAQLDRGGAVGSTVERIHQLIDFVLPVVAGAALGVASHYLRLRARIAANEQRRADDLRARLHKTERDQAVWVIAASLLHDLKNPLHTLGLVLDEASAAASAEEREVALEQARTASDRMLAHLNALKSLPALGRPELREVDIADAVAEASLELGRLADAERVHLRVRAEHGIRALVSPSYLAIVLQTLVENSVDALRDRDGVREIDLEVLRIDQRPTVRLRDTGPGISTDRAVDIFEPLSTSKAHGLGLGLPIARALARAMKGNLALEEGVPTTFRLELAAP
jgi:C4-dicarboxylate-specific signal transduction histidine kinase